MKSRRGAVLTLLPTVSACASERKRAFPRLTSPQPRLLSQEFNLGPPDLSGALSFLELSQCVEVVTYGRPVDNSPADWVN